MKPTSTTVKIAIKETGKKAKFVDVQVLELRKWLRVAILKGIVRKKQELTVVGQRV